MPSTVLPLFSAEELDDLIYYTRTGDLAELKPAILQLSQTHASPVSTIITSAIDVDEDGLGSRSCLLHWPAANGNLEILEYLLSSLPQFDQNSTPPPNPRQIGALLVNHQNNSGNTPLHWAALNGNLSCAKALATAGADASITNAVGHDPVYEAECSGKEGGKEVAEWLLAHCEGLEKGASGSGAEQEAESADVAKDAEMEDQDAS